MSELGDPEGANLESKEARRLWDEYQDGKKKGRIPDNIPFNDWYLRGQYYPSMRGLPPEKQRLEEGKARQILTYVDKVSGGTLKDFQKTLIGVLKGVIRLKGGK